MGNNAYIWGLKILVLICFLLLFTITMLCLP
jgi:hypothetical protein